MKDSGITKFVKIKYPIQLCRILFDPVVVAAIKIVPERAIIAKIEVKISTLKELTMSTYGVRPTIKACIKVNKMQ